MKTTINRLSSVRRLLAAAACGAASMTGVARADVNAGTDAVADQRGVPMVAIDSSLNTRPVRLLGIEPDTAEGGGALRARVIEDGEERVVRLAGEDGLVALAPAWWGDARVNEETTAKDHAAAPPARSQESMPTGWLRLVDGQRIRGQVGGYPTDAERLLWIGGRLSGVMVVNVPLEQVSSLDFNDTLRANVSPTQRPSEDLVVLANGDRLSGFVDRILTLITLEPSGSGAGKAEPMEISMTQVARVELANPLEPGIPAVKKGEAMPSTVWLDGGDVLRVVAPSKSTNSSEPAATDEEGLPVEKVSADKPGTVRLSSTLETASTPVMPAAAVFSLDELVSIEAVAGSIRAVSGLEMVSFMPTGDRREGGARPPKIAEDGQGDVGGFGARDVTLDGPMQVEWALPGGAAAIAGTLVMPREAWAWGDCRVRVSIVNADGTAATSIGEGRLSRETPAIQYRGSVGEIGRSEGARLRLSIDQGERGPIQDVVVVRDAVVLVSAP